MEEPIDEPYEPEDYEDKEHEEYYVDNIQCLCCGEIYSYNDMSPEYVKAGYCSRGCAEADGYFNREV